MYLDFLVAVPNVKGKITHKPKGDAIYVNYEYGREYDREKKYNVPKRVIIGKLSKADHSMMQSQTRTSLHIFLRLSFLMTDLIQTGVVGCGLAAILSSIGFSKSMGFHSF